MNEGRCFESFPKRAMMKSFSLTAFFPRATKYVGMSRLIEWLFSCNRGLQGTIWPSAVKKFPDDHANNRKRGARILSFTGDKKFLDSLHAFPRGFKCIYTGGGNAQRQGRPASGAGDPE